MGAPPRRVSLPLALSLLGWLWPQPTHAQFRYLLSTDLRERYDSNVFAGVTAPDWDMVTEIEPGFRAYYNQRAALLWLNYRFTFQAFARTMDPTAERKLLGYANHLHLEYTRLLSASSGIRFYSRFAQGTENTQVLGGVNPYGGIESGYLSTGSKFISGDSRLEFQRLWSPRWSSRFWLDGSLYRPIDRPNQTVLINEPIAPPSAWALAPTHRLDYLARNDVLHLQSTFTTLLESRPYYAHDLASFLLDQEAGWRHYFSDFWEARLNGGLNIHSRQLLDPASGRTWFDSGVGPIGGAGIRYRRARELLVALDYVHSYRLTLDLGTATTADTDNVLLELESTIHRSWLFQVLAAFRYLRTAPRQAGALQATTKVVTARVSLAYQIRGGISVDIGYDLELVRDRPALGQTGQPGLSLLPTDYTRHIVGIGISLAWPPIPPQDTQLARRVSQGEPIFALGPEGASPTELRDAEAQLKQQRIDRERRERRARRMRQQEPDQPQPPVEELPEPDLSPALP